MLLQPGINLPFLLGLKTGIERRPALCNIVVQQILSFSTSLPTGNHEPAISFGLVWRAAIPSHDAEQE